MDRSATPRAGPKPLRHRTWRSQRAPGKFGSGLASTKMHARLVGPDLKNCEEDSPCQLCWDDFKCSWGCWGTGDRRESLKGQRTFPKLSDGRLYEPGGPDPEGNGPPEAAQNCPRLGPAQGLGVRDGGPKRPFVT
jgi:hypothetical protein